MKSGSTLRVLCNPKIPIKLREKKLFRTPIKPFIIYYTKHHIFKKKHVH